MVVMAAFIWMLAWLPQVLSAMSKLPQPANLTLNSIHFSHVLKWEPGPRTPPGVHYNVTITTETGTSWIPVAGCQHVQHPLVCNLTEAFHDKEQVYLIRIKALLATQDSLPVFRQGFLPIRDTHLDLPLLTVTSCGKNLCVALQPPMEHLREIYDSLNYKLRIKSNNSDRAQFFKDIKSLRGETLKDVASGRTYCVSICFSDRKVPRESNYSQPVCAQTPVNHTADAWISAVMCILVMSFVVALLAYTGFIHLTRRPLPLVLTNIHHNEEVLVIASDRMPLCPVLNIEPTMPSSVEKTSSQTSDESERASFTEINDGFRGGGYKLRGGTNLLSSSSSSSSSVSSSAEPELPKQTSVFHNPEPEPLGERQSNAGVNPQTDAHSDSLLTSEKGSVPCLADTDNLVAGRNHPNREKGKMTGEGDSQDVNLLTLVFGRHGNVEEKISHFDVDELKLEDSCPSVVDNVTPSQSRDNKEVALSCSVSEEEEEEEEEDLSGYIGRPVKDDFQSLL